MPPGEEDPPNFTEAEVGTEDRLGDCIFGSWFEGFCFSPLGRVRTPVRWLLLEAIDGPFP